MLYRGIIECLTDLYLLCLVGWTCSLHILSGREPPTSGCVTTSLPITCGVPQGSILGPILFLLYINDIYRSSSLLSFILFADDTSLFYSSANLTQAIAVVNEELMV